MWRWLHFLLAFLLYWFFLFFSSWPISELGSIMLHKSVKYPWNFHEDILFWLVLGGFFWGLSPWLAGGHRLFPPSAHGCLSVHTGPWCLCVLTSDWFRDRPFKWGFNLTCVFDSVSSHILSRGLQHMNLAGRWRGVHSSFHNMTKLLFCHIIYLPSLQFSS